jgi:lipoate-protein ligase A
VGLRAERWLTEQNRGNVLPVLPAPLPPRPAAPPRWHLWLDETPRPGWANMALDMALLDRAEQYGESWLRLYTWSPHCLSFGRHEPATRRYDLARISALGLDTVRRPTGGRAVWHARELTYAVAAPGACFGTLAQAYEDIHQMLGKALSELGAEVTLAPSAPTPGLGSGPCFARAVGGEVLVRGRKVIGSAQMRRANALLQHGSILLHDDQSMISQLEKSSSLSPTACSWAGLTDPQGEQVQAGAVAAAVARTATSRWEGSWEQVTDPGSVLRQAATHFRWFASGTWTWAR